jgi:cardiolipin synthase
MKLKAKKYLRNIEGAFGKYRWWQSAIFAIGVLAILGTLGALFFNIGSSPEELYPSEIVPSVNDPQFATDLAHTVNADLAEGGTVKILNNGDEFFPSLLSAIKEAKKTINFSVYIWEKGQASTDILNALIEKQKEGVQVRVLLDSLGSRKKPNDLFDELESLGGKIQQYRSPKLGKLTRYHKRNHRRSIVIDGEVGFVGGMAVADSWLGNAESPEHWRDIMFKVTGPLARSLQDAFVDHWAGSKGEILLGEDFFPLTFPASVNSSIKFIHLASSPANDSQPMPKFMLLPILAAKEKLYISTPYLIADHDLMKALKDKANSGVDVELLLPGKNIDNRISRWNSQSYYQKLLEAGVKIYEYQPTFNHSKYITVDGSLSVIGSANLNNRSRKLDEENVMAVFDGGLAGELDSTFTQDLKLAKEIKLDEWQKRNIFARILQATSRIFGNQF